ncbi:MAG: glycosyltransferase family 4 protein [Spartobacteria bacterium]
MQPSPRPLRILTIVNLPWDARLGASRVWMELAREWARAGHSVEKYCLTDAFPEPPYSRAGSALRQILFPRKAADYVRAHADRFDVIDCLIGVLPFPKHTLRFRGLVVARSVGLFRLYNQFLRRSAARGPKQSEGRWFGHLFHRFIEWRARIASEKSLRTCDLLNLPNEDERRALASDPAIHAHTIVEPYGLNEQFLRSLREAAAPAQQRLQGKTICFIGMWGPRKGAREWPQIMKAIWSHHPTAQFVFLGTMFDEAAVRADLGAANETRISCRPNFVEQDLPAILADCALGIFPSHIEGFGLAVLEQLGAGLPTIAYDVPGPRQILQGEKDRLLVPVGDIAAIADRALHILSLPLPEYEALSAECIGVASRYRWKEIAANTIVQYRRELTSLTTEANGSDQ